MTFSSSHRRRLHRTALALAAAAAFGPWATGPAIAGGTDTWEGLSGDAWSSTLWSGGVPGAGSTIYIGGPTAATTTLFFDAAATDPNALSLTVEAVGGTMQLLLGAANTLTTTTLTLGSSLNAGGLLGLGGGGTLNVTGQGTIGDQGTGTLNLSNGSASFGLLVLGGQSTGSGTVNLSGGVLGGYLVVGDAGSGVFNNANATHNVTGNLVLGSQGTGNGSYTITGNTAQTNIAFIAGGNGGNTNGALIIGNGGTGSFVQGLADGSDGGNQVNVAGDLVLGQQAVSTGSYTLNAGTLSVGGQLAVGGQSTGNNVFTQNGGAVVLTGLANGPNGSNPDYVPVGPGSGAWGGALAIGGGIGNGDGSNSGGTGTYNLNAGTISTYNLLVGPSGTGTMVQTGGQVTTTFLTVGFAGSGTYNLQGDATSTVSAYSESVGYAGTGIFNQSGGVNTIATTLEVGQQYGSNSLGYGAYNLTGGTLNSGNTTVGDGEAGDFVNAGAIHNVIGNLVVGDQPAGVGTYTLSGNAALLNIAFLPGGNTGTAPNGTPLVGNGALIVGNAGAGSFTQGLIDQSDPLNQVIVAGDLALGLQAGSTGTYTLNSGTLTIGGALIVGEASTNANVFTQNGGTVTLSGSAGSNASYSPVSSGFPPSNPGSLYVGGVSDSGTGTYVMTGGTLQASSITLGYSGTGTFQQSGGQVSTGYLDLGDCGGCNGGNSAGFYLLTGGSLNTGGISVGDFGHGEFLQSGSATVNTVSGTLSIGNGATATPNTANPGNYDRSGLYTLVDGLLSTQYTVVGAQGTGNFVQSGGTHAVALTLTLGQTTQPLSGPVGSGTPGNPVFGGPAPGVYAMSGGILTAGGDPGNNSAAIIVGDAGTGTFTQTGGLVTAGSWYDGQVLAGGAVVGTAAAGHLIVGASGTGTFSLGVTGQTNNVPWAGYPGGAPGTSPPSFDASINAPWTQVFGNIVIARDTGSIGSFTIAGDGSTLWSNYVVNSGTGGTLAVGLSGTGSFVQSDASTAYLDGGLAIGIDAGSVGSYTLNGGARGGGTLNVGGDLNIGGSDDASGGPLSQTTSGAGSGSFVQNAGAVGVIGHLSIATNAGAVGSYALAGGSLNVGGPAYIGNNGGVGTFTQSGGSATLGGLWLGTTPAGGPASLGRYSITGNASVLNVNGDTLIATAPGTSGSSLTIGDGADSPSVNFNGYLTVGAGDAGSLTIQSGSTTVSYTTYIGGSPTGVGSVTQTGGSFSTGYLDIGTVTGSGSPANRYALSGNGSVTVLANLVIGSGALSGNPDGSGGSFMQSGSSQVGVQGSLYINNGSYGLNAGSLTVGDSVILGDTKTGAQFNQTGGTSQSSIANSLIVGGTASLGAAYSLAGGTLAVGGTTFVGAAGTGNFLNDAAMHTTQDLVVGQTSGSTGTYTLQDGGQLQVTGAAEGFLDVGESGTGTFTQTGGGTSVVGALDVGRFGGASGPGTFNLGGGTLSVSVNAASSYGGFAVVGDSGVGVFNQSGSSTVSIAAGLTIGRQAGGSGTYNANGGSLNVTGPLVVQAVAGSTGILNVAGAAVAADSLVNSGTVNYSAGSITLAAGAGTFTNNAGGSLSYSGAGTRRLSGSLTNAGQVAAQSSPGTLQLDGSFTQAASGTLGIALGGSAGSSLLAAGGSAALGGTLDLLCYGECSYSLGQTIVILTAGGGVTGTFAGSPVLSGFASGAFTVDYSNPGEVVLDVTQATVAAVPEPRTWALLLAGLAAVGSFTRRRRGAMVPAPLRH